ncbi:hypothetical protein [Geobacter pickeringii]|uniref:Uncharacterized protein n=1 Tax=Geobacter pickeringii TaxID=345632 RepID=A0A0B5B754_9BACT|nr:hypothetical protein [Geobacter pickeringii]AJE02338.1 hypothetical protein GPICK_02160 [Geobacter pickeringii]
MKATIRLLVAALLAVTSLPVLATDHQPASKGKDLCLLSYENCPERKDDILELIAKLKREIARGTDVYTPAELRILEQKLEEYQFLLDVLLHHNSR